MNKCSKCGNDMSYEKRYDSVTYNEHKECVLELSGWWCTSCGDTLLECETLHSIEEK